jgi:hypothetical protein
VITLAPQHPGDLDRLAALIRAEGHEPRLGDAEITVAAAEPDAGSMAGALNKAAAARGIVLTELHTSRPSLESQYLAAIGGER